MKRLLLATVLTLAVSPVQAAKPLILQCDAETAMIFKTATITASAEVLRFREVSDGMKTETGAVLKGELNSKGVSGFGEADGLFLMIDRDDGSFTLRNAAGDSLSGHCAVAKGF